MWDVATPAEASGTSRGLTHLALLSNAGPKTAKKFSLEWALFGGTLSSF